VPSWRFDLSIEEDLVEEVGRIHGYEHVGETIPQMQFIPEGKDVTHRHLRSILVGMGLQEVITYIFTSDIELSKAKAPLSEVKLVAPQGADRSVLRTALYPNLVQAAANNHHVPSLALFEIGRVFNQEETERLSMLERGSQAKGIWQSDQHAGFYAFKGMLEKLARILGITLELSPNEADYLHPGISACVSWNGKQVGMMGKLHPEIATAYELEDIYIAELEMPLTGSAIRFKDYARQPHAERDIAVIVPKDVNYASLETLVREAAGEKLERVWPFDVYEGQPIPDDKKSLALRLWFRDVERTLRDEEIEGFMGNVITILSQKGYAIRDK
jgi:phenylalanyl-tRNA synthetase beta chain